MPPRPTLAFLACFALLAGAAPRAVEAAKPTFGFDDVDARAKALADTAFKDPGPNLPGPLQQLDHERHAAIRYKPEAARWH
ncbi:MAG: glucan biosynthesis protein, partial [Rhodanobacteraceae bacterium]